MRIRNRALTAVVVVVSMLTAGLGIATPAWAVAPTISSFAPTSGPQGTSVVVTGTGFAAPASVFFAGVQSTSVQVNSATKITATVPRAAGTGTITVTTGGGTATSSGTFTVRPGLSLSATSGPPNTQRTAYFSGLGAYEAVDIYFDTTDVALASADDAGAGQLSISIPAAATPGVHYVTVVGRHSGFSAQTTYTVRTNWVQYGYAPNHRGNNTYESTLTTSNVASLDEAWRTPAHSYMYGSPAIANGVVYAAFGDGTVAALDETSGAQKWSKTIGASIVSSPAFSNGTVYVGADDDYLYALNASTGAVKWRYLTGDVVRSSPTVANGVVYFGSFDRTLYALDATTGALKWSFPTSETIFSSPAVSNGLVYVGNNAGNLYAVDAVTGTMRWTFTAANSIYASPIAVNGRVYVGSIDDNFYAVHATSGSLAWSYTATSAIEATAAYANGVVFVSSDDAKVYAFDGGTGTLRWTVSETGAFALQQAVTVENGVVFVGDYDHTFAHVASYGGLLTTLNAGTFYGGPAVTNGAFTVPDYSDGILVHYTLNGAVGAAAPAAPSPAALRPNLELHRHAALR